MAFALILRSAKGQESFSIRGAFSRLAGRLRLPDAREQMTRILSIDRTNIDALRAIRMIDRAMS